MSLHVKKNQPLLISFFLSSPSIRFKTQLNLTHLLNTGLHYY